jgi:hypothetical protein
MTDAPHTCACGCGAIRFAVTGRITEAGYCHCTRCRRRTGTAAAISATVEKGGVEFLAGEDQVRYWRPPGGWAKAFCGTCGSALYSEHPQDPEIKSVRLGTFDADPGVRPSYRQFVRYAAWWEPIPDDGLPRYEERRPGV